MTRVGMYWSARQENGEVLLDVMPRGRKRLMFALSALIAREMGEALIQSSNEAARATLAEAGFPHPGEIIADEMQARGMTAEELDILLGWPAADVLAGTQDITPERARGLSAVFGVSERFFLNLQRIYDRKLSGVKWIVDLVQGIALVAVAYSGLVHSKRIADLERRIRTPARSASSSRGQTMITLGTLLAVAGGAVAIVLLDEAIVWLSERAAKTEGEE